jgi:integrase
MGRKTTGTLFKRGRFYCLRYQLDGKRVDRTLKGEDGEPITDLAAAEDARRALLAPLAFKDKAQQRREIAKALRTAEDEAAEAERIANERREREEAERNKLPIAEAWDRYPYTETTRGAVTRPLKQSTISDLAGHWSTFAAWAAEKGIGAVEDITEDHAAAFSRHLRKQFTANRHNKIVQTCGVVCRLSGRPDPFATVKRYSVKGEEVHRANLEPEDRRNLIEKAPGEYRRLFLLGTFTGLRLGDCATLQWSDIHMGDGLAHIIRRTAKTGREVSFTIHPELREELEQTPAAQRTGDVCPQIGERYRRDKQGVSKVVRGIFEKCEMATRIEAGKGRSRAASVRGFHSFRVAFVTDCARAGVPLGLVQSWLGHSSVETTRIYERWDTSREGGRVVAALASMTKALPEGPERPATIEGEGDAPAVEIETERDQLARLARELPAARVRDLLDIAAAWGRK